MQLSYVDWDAILKAFTASQTTAPISSRGGTRNPTRSKLALRCASKAQLRLLLLEGAM